MNKNFIIKNNIDELTILFDNIENLLNEWNLNCVVTIELVIEEALSNIIFYAFEDDLSHDIEISFNLDSNILTIQIIDDGKFFDPTKHQLPDINLSAEERKIGGLGISIILNLMNKVTYNREENKNILTLIKNYENKILG